MQFVRRRLADLRPAEYNPRKTLQPSDPEYQQIRASLDEFGYADPIVINADGTIIKGHQRRTVMMDLGYTEADVVVLDIPDKTREQALNIALNKLTGKWDEDKLREVLSGLDLESYDFTVTGFTRSDLDGLRLGLIPDEAQDDGFAPDAAIQEAAPITRPGDLWQLGRHRLLCGDATDIEDIRYLLDGAQLDLAITDPPYNVDYRDKMEYLAARGRSRVMDQIANDRMDGMGYGEFAQDAFRGLAEVLRPGAAVYVFHSDSTEGAVRAAMEDNGIKVSQCLIWRKDAFVLGRHDYQWQHEPVLYGWRQGAAHYFGGGRAQSTMLEDPPDLRGMRKQELLAYIDGLLRDWRDQVSVLDAPRPGKSRLHPTMKPVPLIGRLMANSSRPGWAVGDMFAGSGSTLMAAEQLGRTAYLMELDPRNCDVIVRRWEAYTGDAAVRISGGGDG